MTSKTADSKPLMKSWAEAMAPFMNAMLPSAPGSARPDDTKSKLEDHFASLNATWKESIEKWPALAKEGANPAVMTPEALRAIFTPAHWSGASAGTFDAGLREVLEGPKYATLWNMDRESLQLQQRAAERDKRAMAFQAIVRKALDLNFTGDDLVQTALEFHAGRLASGVDGHPCRHALGPAAERTGRSRFPAAAA